MNISIIGTGFAALTAIRETRKRAPQAKITVISPRRTFDYYPSLIWLPSGLRSGDELRIDLSKFFQRQRVEFVEAAVENVTNGGRTVVTTTGEIENDGLIIACGGRFIKKLPGIEHALTPCAGIEVTEEITRRLNALDSGTIAFGFGGNPNEPSAMRGGPMFEFLFGIDEQLRRSGKRDKFKLVFFNPAPQPGKRLGPEVPGKLLAMMGERGIETHLGHKMRGFEANRVLTEGGEIDADLILFMPGMTGPAWLASSDLPKSEGGMIKAGMTTLVEGYERVFVAGDAGSFPGPEWQAKQGHAADLQAKVAAENLIKSLNGQSDFVQFKHELICIIDTLSHGIMVKRTEQRATILPPLKIMHWAKRLFEWQYLRQYR
jgi:sulfide:quinone oxidoreductase